MSNTSDISPTENVEVSQIMDVVLATHKITF